MATILAVDDRAINREFLATLLGYAGHKVLQASDGAEALAIARSQRPDLVITDVLMPIMGGVEFADHVHNDPTIAHTPIIFYTATYRVTDAHVLAQACHVSAVLAKPSEPQAILDAVAAALGTGPAIALMPDTATAQAGFLGAKLPAYLHDLSDLQERLRRTLDRAIEQGDTQIVTREDSDAVAYSLQSLSMRLATLLELDLALASERDPQSMLVQFCHAAQSILRCKFCAIGILGADGRRLQDFAARGFDDETRQRLSLIDPTSGMLGNVIKSGKSLRVRDQSGKPTTLELPEFHPPITSLLAVPLPARSAMSLAGWIYFADKLENEAFNGEDEQFAVTLAAQLSLAYGNLAMYDELQEHAVKLELEVAERRRAQMELAHRMNHDQTTGLPRFVSIEAHLQGAFARATTNEQRVIVLYVDIDRFHAINKTRGRDVGDHVLRTFAERLKAMVAPGEWVAHVAADEFAVVLVDVDGAQDQVEIAETMRRKLEQPIADGNQRIYVTCSIGVSCFPDNGSSAQELLSQAESAMMRAKQEGRNTISAFANENKQELEDSLIVGQRLGEAIRDGQLVLHYQPQISGRDWQILGFEALVRWQSPEFGLLPPQRFLHVAEDLGLIVDIGSFVLESVCQQARAWLDAGVENFLISINVAGLQLQRPQFVEEVRSALAGWELPAHHIELELTESMMAGNVERVIATMRELKALGVRLALDDFGTGYSSLNYLRHFPLDKLKIDQSFVRDISSDVGAAGICRAIIGLGHQLGMIVLAEGVETAAQVGYLRRNDCDEFQGFYFSKAVTASQALVLLHHRYMAHEGLSQKQESQTLLLVDDEENILNALNRVLRRDGYRIFTATSVDLALDILARNEVEVILSDQRMPETSGTEFLSKVKEMYPDTVRMMLSGYTDLQAVTEAINRGAIYKFLIKPWNDEDLRLQIREAFRMHRSRMTEKNLPDLDG